MTTCASFLFNSSICTTQHTEHANLCNDLCTVACFDQHACDPSLIVGLDLSEPAGLQAALAAVGYNTSLPCIWVLEAVLYYMEIEPACLLLQTIAGLSPARSTSSTTLIATCIDAELLAASQRMEAGSHIFAKLWYFNVNELLSHPAYMQSWATELQPQTTKMLALQRYSADTYVALYGGAECVFTASLVTEV